MEFKEMEIWVFDKREKSRGNLYVEPLSENEFRMSDNDLLNCRLTKGTEFRTRINSNGDHEIIKILKDSEFTTRRFLLSPTYKESDYRFLGEELIKQGGFWQVDFGGILTINIPEFFEFDVDQVMKELDLKFTEIIE
ncbi:hypothetical protein LX97_00071 [Nonlabens dokdonensis]|uniref:Uncharacterized protein n=2 Tax=Nonlabens dokdonensis TaxID=328515 RepID=L7W1M6_NONDD|nr:hypothetical protein [Nonlabens dokdonensis]AGC75370.1 hypothetical protein DDD_0243 [Nonlabens dokdonensis DSW-6]PZX43072.1 hypothetical protein LX97_00071 [Nonlabens dokdonensis]